MALIIDRNYIVENIAQGGQVPASSFVAMGLTDADGSQFYQNAGNNSGYPGYYNVSADAYQDNWNSAIETLKKYYTYDEASGKFTDMPSMVYLYNTSEGHKAIAENIQGIFGSVGCNMSLENQEWNTFLDTRKNGDYTIVMRPEPWTQWTSQSHLNPREAEDRMVCNMIAPEFQPVLRRKIVIEY
jgi:oligopeptide transport system substrate-binding protein